MKTIPIPPPQLRHVQQFGPAGYTGRYNNQILIVTTA
jgi:hypothetical protein